MNKEYIGIREFVAIIIITLTPKVAEDTPTFLFEKAGNAGWIVAILASILALVPILLLMSVINHYENHNLVDIIYDLFGKWASGIFVFLLWIVVSSYMVIDSAIIVDLIATLYYPNTARIAVYLLFMVVCAYGTYKGMQSVGTIAWLVLPILVATLLFSLILGAVQGQASFLYPIFGEGIWEIVKTTTTQFSIYADILFFFIFVTILKDNKAFKKAIWIAFPIIIIQFTTAMITFVMVFDFESLKLVSYPYHELIRFISIGFITNIESLYFPFWIIGTLIRYSVYFYLCTYILARFLNIKDYRLLIPIYGILIILIGSIPNSPPFQFTYIKTILIYFATVFFITAPLMIWLRLAWVRRRRKCSKQT